MKYLPQTLKRAAPSRGWAGCRRAAGLVRLFMHLAPSRAWIYSGISTNSGACRDSPRSEPALAARAARIAAQAIFCMIDNSFFA
jgi:hypothetical protein